MTESRATVLSAIRTALGTPAVPQTPPDAIPRGYLRQGANAPGSDHVIELLVDRLVDYKAHVQRIDADGLPSAMERALTGTDSIIIAPGLDPAIVAAIGGGRLITTDNAPAPLSPQHLDACDAVVTTARVAIALSGTIVLDAGPGQGRRAITLVPDRHVIVLRERAGGGVGPRGHRAVGPHCTAHHDRRAIGHQRHRTGTRRRGARPAHPARHHRRLTPAAVSGARLRLRCSLTFVSGADGRLPDRSAPRRWRACDAHSPLLTPTNQILAALMVDSRIAPLLGAGAPAMLTHLRLRNGYGAVVTTESPSAAASTIVDNDPFPRLAQSGALHASASVVGLGCWQLGADWGEVSENDAIAVLQGAFDAGVTFFDTADVYGDGRSEQLIGRFLRGLGSDANSIMVATKVGRRADPFAPETFTEQNLRSWVDRSRSNLGVDTLDLVQLHCPPTATFSDDAVFDVLDALLAEGALAGYGVSVETCAEALTAIARPGVSSVQIILNAFRLKPLDEVLPAAQAAGVGVIARVPLASGLLSGRYSSSTTFASNDHRNYNRSGAAFDVGETFSGVDYETGLAAVAELTDALPDGLSLPQAALRWIVDQPGVTTVIPGARNPAQARGNAAAALLPTVPAAFSGAVRRVYDERLRADIHPRW